MGADDGRIRLWLWDGVSEYEGRVVRAEGRSMAACLRQGTVGTAGRREGTSPTLFQRRLAGRRCLVHFRGVGEGVLLEAEMVVAQRCSDPSYDLKIEVTVLGDQPDHEQVIRRVGEYYAHRGGRRRAG